MKMAALAVMVVMAAGCGSSKYAVKQSKEPKARIVVAGQELVSIMPNDAWVWHVKPEQAVAFLLNLVTSQQAEIEKLKTPAPAAAQKKKVSVEKAREAATK